MTGEIDRADGFSSYLKIFSRIKTLSLSWVSGSSVNYLHCRGTTYVQPESLAAPLAHFLEFCPLGPHCLSSPLSSTPTGRLVS